MHIQVAFAANGRRAQIHSKLSLLQAAQILLETESTSETHQARDSYYHYTQRMLEAGKLAASDRTQCQPAPSSSRWYYLFPPVGPFAYFTVFVDKLESCFFLTINKDNFGLRCLTRTGLRNNNSPILLSTIPVDLKVSCLSSIIQLT
jgi:hypothetical protein